MECSDFMRGMLQLVLVVSFSHALSFLVYDWWKKRNDVLVSPTHGMHILDLTLPFTLHHPRLFTFMHIYLKFAFCITPFYYQK